MDEIQQYPHPPAFFSYRYEEEPSSENRLPRFIESTPRIECVATCLDSSWLGFESCLICLDEWNTDFGGPLFSTRQHYGDRHLKSLALQVTMQNDSYYPILATGYAYDDSNELLGLLDFRYFGRDMPRALCFDVSTYQFPASTQFRIAFQVGGGGSPRVPRPPSITSVAMSARVSVLPDSR